MVGCETVTQREIAQKLGRPKLPSVCISNGDGTCFRDGELENTTNMGCGDLLNEYAPMQDYLWEIEKRLYFCLKYKNSRKKIFRKYCN